MKLSNYTTEYTAHRESNFIQITIEWYIRPTIFHTETNRTPAEMLTRNSAKEQPWEDLAVFHYTRHISFRPIWIERSSLDNRDAHQRKAMEIRHRKCHNCNGSSDDRPLTDRVLSNFFSSPGSPVVATKMATFTRTNVEPLFMLLEDRLNKLYIITWRPKPHTVCDVPSWRLAVSIRLTPSLFLYQVTNDDAHGARVRWWNAPDQIRSIFWLFFFAKIKWLV